METRLPPLLQALLHPDCYDHAVREMHIVETHISWVILTGSYAYKIKKPVNLGFLDFSTLEKRRFYCEQEWRLNRRLAEALYLGVVAITGSESAPRVNENGVAIEYAVKMVQFPESARLDRMLARGELLPRHIDSLAQELAEFHGRIAIAGDDKSFGDPDHVNEPVRQNFEQMESRIETRHRAQLQRLQTWSMRTFTLLKNTFAERKRRGFIRECHGDAHLANMIWLNERVTLFDCLEFNENLRWIDTMGETAFLTMDLDDRGRSDLARRAVNAYLEFTGDYEGLAVYRFYQVYRALVRAKVACIRLSQEGLDEQEKQRTGVEYLGYADLAERYTQPLHPALIVTHGLSGSGKTWLSQQLLEAWDVIRLRSDIERKRLHGLAPHARSGSDVDQGIYSAESSRQTYARLAELARSILATGYPVMVDAAFLKRNQRERLRAVAHELRVPCMILDLQAPESLLRERLRQRVRQSREVSEASLAVLQRQLATHEPLTADEQRVALTVSPDAARDIGGLVQKMNSLTGTP